jgi:hypothetical protein
MSTIHLNLRQKAALCSTLICVGLLLLLSTGLRATVGILLLGIAYSWALGSNTRAVRWLFLSAGVLLLLVTPLETYLWQQGKPELISLDTSIVQGAQSELDSDITVNSRVPGTVSSENLAKDYEALSKAKTELALLKGEKPLPHALKNDWGSLVGGLLLFSSGVGLIIGLREKKVSVSNVKSAPMAKLAQEQIDPHSI